MNLLRLKFFLLIFCLYLSATACLGSDGKDSSLIIYNGEGKKVFYRPKDDTYHFSSPQRSIATQRHYYQDFKQEIRPYISNAQWERVSKRIDNHYKLQRISNPSAEEMLEEAFASRDLSLALIDQGQISPCAQDLNNKKFLQGPTRYQIELSDKQAEALDKAVKEKLIRENTFMGLGELTGLEVKLETGNDNFLVGATTAIGLTENAKGIEGDDRGKTMNQDLSLAFIFDKGEIKLGTSATGYGKLVGLEKQGQVKMAGKSYGVSQKEYEYQDEEGKYYQNFLSVDGIVLEVRKNLEFGKDTIEDEEQLYVRVVGRIEDFDDQSGLGKEIQEKWHKAFSDLSDASVEYNYQDHMKAYTRYSAKIELGEDEVIKATNDYEVSMDKGVGVQFSNRDSGQQVNMRASLKIATADGGENNRYPTWEGRISLEAGVDRNREEFVYSGAEVTRRFNFSDKSSLAISAGMSYEDDPLARSYSSEELEDNGGQLDIYHTQI